MEDTDPCMGAEIQQPKKGRTKPKKEIDDIGKIEAEGMAELEEKLKTMKVSKKLKKKLLKEEAERQKIKGMLISLLTFTYLPTLYSSY